MSPNPLSNFNIEKLNIFSKIILCGILSGVVLFLGFLILYPHLVSAYVTTNQNEVMIGQTATITWYEPFCTTQYESYGANVTGWTNYRQLGTTGSINLVFNTAGTYSFDFKCGGTSYSTANRIYTVAFTVDDPAHAPSANVTYSTEVLGSQWVRGSKIYISWNKLSFGSSLVDVWVCTGTNPNTNCSIPGGYSAAALGIDNNGAYTLDFKGPAGTYYFYVRKNNDWSNTYSGNGFSSSAVFYDSAPLPKVNSVNAAEVNWQPWTTHHISWTTSIPEPSSYSVYICKPDAVLGTTACLLTGDGNGHKYNNITAKSLDLALGDPNSNSTLAAYYNMAGLNTNLTVCPNGNNIPSKDLCASINIIVGNPVPQPPLSLPSPPKVNSVSANEKVWKPWTTHHITWTSSGNISSYSVYICNHDNQNCLLAGDGKGYKYNNITNKYFDLSLGDPRSSSAVVPYYDTTNFTTDITVCPNNNATVLNPFLCSSVNVAVGSYSYGSMWFQPEGAGCFIGDCVCVGGKPMKCGNPMQSGTGCPITACL